ncbi:hypothetical protein DYBT9275_03767 [Dyadobacter sp. CECT 9275]|uniref:Uncharacterized protein n=1 Tax=Dyadobacter helix TaxID=2822344 RepID=A0A916JE44_9BACT|nr:hypothetical protein DYBT9275_03767 [Dyadobacter sp. CECT 9275]
MIKPATLLRIAAGCLLFFAVGHSAGHLARHRVTDPKAKEVIRYMTENKFDMFGQMRSYDENYTGMSFNLILTLLCLACILWILSFQAEKQPVLTRNILIPVTICILGFGVTSFLYFFMLPALTCLAASVSMLLCIVYLSRIRSM